jgi:hypothetical protein
VNYVHRKMSLTVKALMSESEAESVMEVESPIAVAYLKKLKVFWFSYYLSQLCSPLFYPCYATFV